MAKAICMVSAGIDSPVAAALVSKQAKPILLHFSLYPFYCERSIELSLQILSKLKKKLRCKKIVIVPWGNILSHVSKKEKHYQCVLCRKAMLVVAKLLAEKEGADVIVTGEALGQKASQTLENLNATEHKLGFPIIRPLIGLNKDEIVAISEREGCWTDKHVGCCSIVPSKPATAADPEKAQKLFKDLKLDKLVKDAFKRRLETLAKFNLAGLH